MAFTVVLLSSTLFFDLFPTASPAPPDGRGMSVSFHHISVDDSRECFNCQGIHYSSIRSFILRLKGFSF